MLRAMPCLRLRWLAAYLATAALALFFASCSPEPELARPNVAPNVPHRVAELTDAGLASDVRGRILLGELGCAGCHEANQAQLEHRQGPDLRTVGSRVHPDFLERFIASPHATDPGTTMPDLLRHLEGGAARAAASAITHYLRSLAPTPPTDTDQDPQAAERGGALFETIGCRTCHLQTTGDLLPSAKYSATSLQDFLLAPHEARPSGRMPSMDLSPAQALDLAAFLLGPDTPKGTAPAPLDPGKVEAGSQLFAELQCSSCHDLQSDHTGPSKAKPLSDLDATQGCLSDTAGPWPHYSLTKAQARDIQNALHDIERPLSGEARVQQLMGSRDCFACHRRGDLDLLSQHEEHFTTRDASIGQDGRLPPTLTGVGGKLQRGWLHNTIGHGQRERPYLVTRMPGFGDEFATRLTAALLAVDEVPDAKVTARPKNRKEAEAVKKVGRQLVGDKGMNCITCHYFAGEKAGAMGAIDLVHSTGKRLRPEWFAAFLRDPFRFKPITLMPEFYPDGKSTRPEIVDGDPQRQIDAMWHYLAAGRNVGKPQGMRHPPIELTVTDEAVMLRRSVRNTGKRGISVGYPGGVNITFDAENLGLNQIWWGRFLDARPVWTGQGSGEAQLLGRQRSLLANGPALQAVPDDEPWPKTTRRERGDRFLGYELDAQQRPTFRYTSGDLTIDDTPREHIQDGDTQLRRTLVVRGERQSLQLLLARHKEITRDDQQTIRVGKWLTIHTGGHQPVILTAGEEKEARLSLQPSNDPSEIQLTYTWTQEGK